MSSSLSVTQLSRRPEDLGSLSSESSNRRLEATASLHSTTLTPSTVKKVSPPLAEALLPQFFKEVFEGFDATNRAGKPFHVTVARDEKSSNVLSISIHAIKSGRVTHCQQFDVETGAAKPEHYRRLEEILAKLPHAEHFQWATKDLSELATAKILNRKAFTPSYEKIEPHRLTGEAPESGRFSAAVWTRTAIQTGLELIRKILMGSSGKADEQRIAAEAEERLKVQRNNLVHWLHKRGIDTSLFNKKDAKSINHLLEEVLSGESKLSSENGQVHLESRVVLLDIFYTCPETGQRLQLKENVQKFINLKDGSRRERHRTSMGSVPAEKMHPHEAVIEAARRGLKEELKITEFTKMTAGEVICRIAPDQNYPGVFARSFFHRVEIEITSSQYRPHYVERKHYFSKDPSGEPVKHLQSTHCGWVPAPRA